MDTKAMSELQPKCKVEISKVCYLFHNLQKPKQLLLRFANKYLTNEHNKE